MKQIKPKYIEVLSKYTMPFTYLILSIVGLALCTSCVSDKLPSPAVQAEEVDVDLSVHVGLEAADDPNATPEEKQLVSLRVYAFDSNGIIDNMKVEKAPEGTFLTNPKMLSMKVEVGKKLFAVIANEPDDLTETLNDIDNIFALRRVVMTNSQFNYNEIESLGENIPFASETDYIDVVQQETKQVIPIGLARAVAKTQLLLTKAPNNTNRIIVKKIELIRGVDKSYLLPNKVSEKIKTFATDLNIVDINEQELEDPQIIDSGEESSGVETETTEWTKPFKKTEPRYLFEYKSDNNDEDTATAYKISVEMDGVNREFTVPIFRSYGPADPSGNREKLHKIERNSFYVIRITFSPNTAAYDYEVLEWGEEIIYNKEAGEEDNPDNIIDWSDEGIIENGDLGNK